ncbi:chemotaxis protein CheA [uncultured Pseudoflavonifractor sp.]|uniref:chemotaxis protein CheA n=1 Tax=uncultured Pseudoflavonifractor sp. TaxID=1221379 RepID=UPI0025EFD30E|nr:chemotaxis protein CheA [uncultured Pseudoflavonifractor sp.]
MSAGNDSILEAFLYETNTLLEQLDSIVLAAEQQDSFSQEDINTIFRIMHTIKGSSAMMEYNSLMTIAHRAEDLFAIIRDKTMDIVPESLRPELFDLLFQTIDFFRQELEHIENDQPLTENIDTLLQKINRVIDEINSGGRAQPQAGPADASGAASGAASVPGHSDFPFGLQVFFDEGCGMENLRAYMLVSSIREICAETDFTYEPQGVDSDPATADEIIESGFHLFFRSQADRDAAIQAVTASGTVRSYQAVDQPAPAPAPAPAESAAAEAPAKPAAECAPPAAKAPAAKAAPVSAPQKSEGPTHHKESLISVSLNKLDHLVAVVGEIVITESMVTSSPELKGLKLDAFTKSARQLRKLTDELQDVSMSLRMVPVSGTFQKMNRIVRDMCKKLGKQARLVLEGEDTEVDKTIVDSIGDPIMHIVRNSMDHGIEEDVQQRIDAGKDPVGEIVLSARHTGSEVIIEIRDDGQGVNYDAVLSKAIRNGLAQPDVEYSHKDILNFLMAPGFSTNTEVTEFSGRGVGMDVVKKNVEEIGGTVTITSEPGQGMTTTLKIPLTMAIMDGMEVSVGGSIFTIPIHNIRQSFKISSSDLVRDAAGGEMFKCLGSFYPVIRMRDLYQMDGGATEIEDGILIWLESGEHSYCLFVDELLGEQQVVVKPLPAYLNRFNIKASGIAGCTILGDGNISIILDVSNLFAYAQ